MALDEINNKLHSRGFHADRTRTPTEYEPGLNEEDATRVAQFEKTEGWNEPPASVPSVVVPVQTPLTPMSPWHKHRKLFFWVLGGLVSLALVAGIIMKIRSELFSEDKITVNIAGSGEVESARPVSFDFEYANTNWVGLENVVVVFEYGEMFQPDANPNMTINTSRAEMALGDIPSQGRGKVTLSGVFYGSKGDQVKIAGTLRYSPSTFETTFEKRMSRTVVITSSPLLFEIDAPIERVSDQEVQYDIFYKNSGSTAFSNLRVRLEYPAEFVFTEADPKPTDGNTVWRIGGLAPGQEGRIAVRGRISGLRDEQKLVQGGIGILQGDGTFLAYGENSRRTKIVASPLSISQTVNGLAETNIDPGQTLSYTIGYRNDGDVGIRDAVISMNIDSPYLDFSTLKFGSEAARGAYVQSSKTIFWRASDLPSLSRIEPGQSATVSFSITSFSDPGRRASGVRDPVIRSVAKIDSPDISAIVGNTKVVASDTLSVKMNTIMMPRLLGFYQDATIPNSGPIPPTVGQETTYTLHLSFANSTNEVKDARVSVFLPSGNRYTGRKSPENEKIVINERTNELVWDMGTIVPGAERTIVFQVGVTPEEQHVDQEILLVNRMAFSGKDAFTGEDIELPALQKKTALPEDTSINSSAYRVRAATP